MRQVPYKNGAISDMFIDALVDTVSLDSSRVEQKHWFNPIPQDVSQKGAFAPQSKSLD